MYKPLPSDDGAENHRPCLTPRKRSIILLAVVLFATSVALNGVLIYQRYVTPWELMNKLPSRVAHLSRNKITKYNQHTVDFTSTNRTIQDSAWRDPELDWTIQIVALEDHHIASLDLLQSSTWPWDSSKKVYVLAGAHDMHCLHALRNALNEYHDGVPEPQHTKPYSHLLHCLNVLRESAMCAADDTPLYVGRYNANASPASTVGERQLGMDTPRMCRDWSAVTNWAVAHSACFKAVAQDNPDIVSKDAFKSCPDHSTPWLN
ncbi:hypothetical protein K461DRAFT_306869 [Myriangium duriaei CBS 260.36]|uniref:Uncharacterized protein n=1 Tax=Myriangium duriaei CBS 260.36 TaxID=1168546 RepID=A0A9P4MLA2_9PEZI|nr:hypothetical protein K461DRAFT_306869 [Myriangium duriaei CBS 260.36]